MSELTKKHPTNLNIKIEISDSKEKLFSVPKSYVKRILALISEYEVDESRNWKNVFSDEIKSIGEGAMALKGCRAKENMTQKRLADLLGVSQSFVAKLENGKKEINKEMAKKLEKIFNIGYKVFL